MKLSDEAISEYQKILKEDYGKEISREEAYEQGLRLVEFFDLLYKIDKRNKKQASQNEVSQQKPDKTI